MTFAILNGNIDPPTLNIAERAAHSRTAILSDSGEGNDENKCTTIYEVVVYEERVVSDYVLGVGRNYPVDRRTLEIAKRASLVMQSLGWAKPKSARIQGRSVRAYVRCIEQPLH
jgi:hypothetical protein